MPPHKGEIDLLSDVPFGLEPAGDPVWEKRARKLARRIEQGGPMTTEEILAWGSEVQGWHEQTTKNVLAWAELSMLACDDAVWRLAEGDELMRRPPGSIASSRVSGVSLMF